MMISMAGYAAYLSIERKSARLAGMRVRDVAENAQQSYGHRVWWEAYVRRTGWRSGSKECSLV